MSTVAELVNSLSSIMNAQQMVLAALAANDDDEVVALLRDAEVSTEAAAGLIINRLGELPLTCREDVAAMSITLAPLAETGRWPAHAALFSAKVAEALFTLSQPAVTTA